MNARTLRKILGRQLRLLRKFARSISLDMIFAAPKETHEGWIADLQQAIALSPDHISTYELTYEKGTSFWARRINGQLQQADDELRADMYLAAIELLDRSGLQHYEISSFARGGHRCRHNQSYWNGTQYFAFGPGASRYIDGIRETNHRSVTTYLKRIESHQSPIDERAELDAKAVAIDRLVFGLRQIDGVSLREICTSTGIDVLPMLGTLANELVEHGLISIDADHCRLTTAGLMVADSICEEIYRCRVSAG